MAKKQYSNVYTILDKARKGELDFDDESSPSLFKTYVPYKRPDIIRPRVHYLDEQVINRYVNNHILSSAYLTKITQRAKAMGYDIDASKAQSQINELLVKFPKGVKNDIFNLFNKDIQNIDFEERGENNKMRYKFIEKANQPVHKIMTIDSNIKSLIFTQHVMEYFITSMYLAKLKEPEKMEQMQQQMQQEVQNACQGGSGKSGGQQQQQKPSDKGPEQDQQSQNQGNDPGQDQQQSQGQDQQPGDDQSQGQPQDSQNQQSDTGGNQSGKTNNKSQNDLTSEQLDKMLQNMLNKNDKELDKLMEQANQVCNKLDETYSGEEKAEMWQEAQGGNLSAQALNPDEIDRIAAQYRDMRMSMNAVTQFIKKIMDNSTNYFSGKEEVTFESMMETGHLDGMEDMYMIHPKLRKFMVEDIMVKDVKKLGKINIYIDVSGSMSATCGVRRQDGSSLSRIDFAKSFALKMLDMDMLNKVFTFNDTVRQRKTDISNILKISCSGGTNTENVIRHIVEIDENAIIITDGTDYVASYTPKAYFIGTQGATFGGYAHLDKYKEQMCVFDGSRIQRIDINGRPY